MVVNTRRRDETRWSDWVALVAAAVAVPVAATSALFTLLVADARPEGIIAATAAIAIPALVAAVAAATASHVLLVRRQRMRDRTANRRLSAARRELRDEKQERALLRELDRALDLASSEQAAIEVIREAFTRHLSMQPMELHLVDPVDPVLTLALATGHEARPGERCSPWDSVATRTNKTLVFDTTDRLDVCSHLKSRLRDHQSAVAVPLNAMGRLLGVLYGFGPEGQEPGVGDVQFLEDLGSSIANHLALLRTAVGTSTTTDDVDRLTGLPDRTATQGRVLRMLRDRVPFTVAVADIDNFGKMNETEGREVGDRALQLLSQVARKTVRPGDIVGRIGGDEFLFVLPKTHADNATRALERLREELVLAQSATDDPAFTLSIGVIGSTAGGTIEEILHHAAGALNHAKSQGGNRVVVAHPAKDPKQKPASS